MTLYLKYRPKNLDELDLPEVGLSLKKIVASGNIPHAFLFAGPKGTGKTSAARILAKIINCEDLGKDGTPCDKCEQCVSITKGNNLDCIEMDAASNRGIDDIRVLRDAVKLAPTKAKKKIYIIDEAHMLTTEASNALLKTLEEPPAHVVFILATTNPEKLIDTIRSRTTLISFRKATEKEIAGSIRRVAEAEGIKIDDDSVNKIAALSRGAFRDAIKMLEQFSLEGPEYLVVNIGSEPNQIMEYLVSRDEKAAVESVEKSINNGMSAENLLNELIVSLRNSLLSLVGVGEVKMESLNKEEIIKLSDLLIEANGKIQDSPIDSLPLEIAIVKWCGGVKKSEVRNQKTDPEVGKEQIQPEKKDQETRSQNSAIDHQIQTSDDSLQTSEVVVQTSEIPNMQTVNSEVWKQILSIIKPINASIEALLRTSQPVAYDGKSLTLGVFYKFHKERLEDAHHRKILEEVITKVLNSPTKVVCTIVDPPPKTVFEEAKVEVVLTESKDLDIIKAAEEIFNN